MRKTTKLKSLLVAGFAVFALNGCSSGTTASGLGLGVGGTWFGNLFINGTVFAAFNMTLLQSATSTTDPFAPSTLTGNLNTNHTCLGSGTIEGSLNANQISLTVTTSNGVLSMAGEAGNSSMGGTWTNAGSIATGEGDSAVTVVCNGGGTWTAHR